MIVPIRTIRVQDVANVVHIGDTRVIVFPNGSIVDDGGGQVAVSIPQTAPGGLTGQVQFNSSGSFGGSAGLTWSGTSLVVRKPGGTAGTDEVQIYHDGVYGYVKAKNGILRLYRNVVFDKDENNIGDARVAILAEYNEFRLNGQMYLEWRWGGAWSGTKYLTFGDASNDPAKPVLSATNGAGGGVPMELLPMGGTPDAPSSGVRYFARVNGGGKTEYCARFPTGSVKVIVTED